LSRRLEGSKGGRNSGPSKNTFCDPHSYLFAVIRSCLILIWWVSITRDEAQEVQRLRSQIVILKPGQHLKYLPYAFTEHGAIMAANVLNSPRAVQMSVFAVWSRVRLRDSWRLVYKGKGDSKR